MESSIETQKDGRKETTTMGGEISRDAKSIIAAVIGLLWMWVLLLLPRDIGLSLAASTGLAMFFYAFFKFIAFTHRK